MSYCGRANVGARAKQPILFGRFFCSLELSPIVFAPCWNEKKIFLRDPSSGTFHAGQTQFVVLLARSQGRVLIGRGSTWAPGSNYQGTGRLFTVFLRLYVEERRKLFLPYRFFKNISISDCVISKTSPTSNSSQSLFSFQLHLKNNPFNLTFCQEWDSNPRLQSETRTLTQLITGKDNHP